MNLRVRRLGLPHFVVLTAFVACGGSTESEGVHPQHDGGSDGAVGHSTTSSSGTGTSGQSSTGMSVATGECNVVQILPPVLTVKDEVTGASICDATAVDDAGPVSLTSCTSGCSVACTGASCPPTCEYNVSGLSGLSTATTITVTAPGYSSVQTSVFNTPCGCNGPCASNQQVTVSLSPVKDAGLGDASPPAAGCPASAPSQGNACSTNGLFCEYGTSTNPYCNSLWQCTGSTWQDASSSGTCPPPDAACPASYAAASANLACSVADEMQLCEYPQGTCICSTYSGGLPHAGGPDWDCTPTTTGCPAAVPELGSPCPNDTPADCDYGQCSGGVGMTCVDGYWSIAMVACPA